jgi:alkylated DNA repair dioxygenase AlkB
METNMKTELLGFQVHDVGGSSFWVGRLPEELNPSAAEFDSLWQMHPAEFHEIEMYGRLVKTPRWQQAYGVDYHYTGRVNKALPMSPLLAPFLRWAQERIDQNLNGLLLNWYDGQLGHYIGRHRNSIKNLIPGTSIVTISLGDERTFRLRRWPTQPNANPIDFPARHGTVFIMPWKTNRAFTHEVPISKGQTGRRISITIRAFTKTTNA